MGKRKSMPSQSHDKVKRNRKSEQLNNNVSNDVDDENNSSAGNLSADISNTLDLSTRSGKILTVKLRNFMCHANLTVDFNARTNLLIGQNGSGKSAILTALIVGLGSKANATNRSSSIKELIKSGESSATIEVHISNDGSDAYDYEKYGNRIIVVRQITASGSSTYKLKSSMGSVISTSRTELLKLILYMNIQVDNPVCVMTQDASRSFLRDSNPKKRYELFLKATQLDVIIEKLDGCFQQTNIAKAKFKAQQKQHAKYLEIQKKAHETLHQFKSMEPLKEETNRYKCERAWLAVVQEEEFMQAVNTEFEGARRKKEEHVQQLVKYHMNDRESNEQNVQLTEEIKQLEQSISAEQRKLDREKNAYRQMIEQVSNSERCVKKLEARIEKIRKTIDTLEENIQQELTSNENQIDEMKQENDTKLNELRKKQEDLESILKSHRRELEIYSNTRSKCMAQLDTANRTKTMLLDERKNVESLLRHMHASPKENLKSYGEYMVKLVDMLGQYFKQGMFQKMPIGPIANHVEVKNAKYRQYVEDALGNVLMAFCVDNANDVMVFREIQKKLAQPQVNIPVICAKFSDRQYDVTGNCVLADANTVRLMDMIVADHPVVMNCLFDQCNIETVLFTPSFDYATHITSKKENVPQNLSKVILTNPYSEYFPAPAYRSYTKQSRPSRNLRVNAADRERAYQNDLMEINEKIEKANSEVEQFQSRTSENGKLAEERRKFIADSDAKLRMLHLEITEIESIEYPQEADVEVMQSEVDEQSKILATLNTEYDKEKEQFNELNASVQEIKANMVEIRGQLQSMENEIQAKQKSKDELIENISKRDGMVQYYQKQMEHLTEAMVKYEKELEKLREKLTRVEATAEKVGRRVEVTHTEEQLAKLIKRNEVKLNAVNISNESVESLTKQAEDAGNNVSRSEDLIKILGSTLKMIHNSIRMRMSNVAKLKQFMVTRTGLYFTAIMKLRDIDGILQFDNDAGKLDIHVVPRDKECSNAVSKTSNLSGGERSYTTVAFLLSLWSCVDHPFYFLDEYDVFTDQVNRMFMTKLLLNEAKKKPLQYTFLTPQDTSEIKQTKDLTILRLENPDR